MKKHTEKPPIDELFARRLGNMSITPSADGFERLQARMGKAQPEARIVFWRNPVMQRYMAAAACLVLVSLFGWLYWPSGSNTESGQTQIATNQRVPSGPPSEKTVPGANDRQPQTNQTSEKGTDAKMFETTPADQVAAVNTNPRQTLPTMNPQKRSVEQTKSTEIQPDIAAMPTVAQTKPVQIKTQTEIVAPVTPVNPLKAVTEQLADNKPTTKPSPVQERVLEVTIAEPEALVAARQAAKTAVETKAMVAQTDKPEKETKAGSLWQQVKRIKNGEVFARQDKFGDDEGGLLGRAYSGLKHSLEKDKSEK
jgi:hypothetical protein